MSEDIVYSGNTSFLRMQADDERKRVQNHRVSRETRDLDKNRADIIAMAFSTDAEVERDLILSRIKEALRARKASGGRKGPARASSIHFVWRSKPCAGIGAYVGLEPLLSGGVRAH
ncbi:MAG: hypothetical protein OXC26_06620 [Albidovulum sp.]|nr:hypothetical protein [Albidovulum sp.]